MGGENNSSARDGRQTICRVASRRKSYTQIDNAILRDTRLSLEARGALALVLSYEPESVFTVDWLMGECGIGCGRAQRIIEELLAHDYCQRDEHREATRRAASAGGAA